MAQIAKSRSPKLKRSCSCVVLDDGSHSVLEEKWEHEQFLGWWTTRFSERYRDADGNESRVNVRLPSQWEWREHLWEIDYDHTGTDKEGWIYASTPKKEYHAKKRIVDMFRKRKWFRRRIWRGIKGRCGMSTPHDQGMVIDITLQGWLLKHYGNLFLGQKMRYFALVDGDTELRYYEEDPHVKDVKPKGVIPLMYVMKVDTYRDESTTHPYGFVLHTLRRSYRLGCSTMEERNKWLRHIMKYLEVDKGTWRSIHISIRDCSAVHIKQNAEQFQIKRADTLKLRGLRAVWHQRTYLLVSPGYLFMFKSAAAARKFSAVKLTKGNYNNVKFIRGLSSLVSECCVVTVQPRDLRRMMAYKGEHNVLTIKLVNNTRFYFAFKTPKKRELLERALNFLILKTRFDSPSNPSKGKRFFRKLRKQSDEFLDWSEALYSEEEGDDDLSVSFDDPRRFTSILSTFDGERAQIPVLDGYAALERVERALRHNQSMLNAGYQEAKEGEMSLGGNKVFQHSDLYYSITTARDRAFDIVSDVDDLIIWRVEDFGIELWPVDAYGTFNSGDVYLILGPEDKDQKRFVFYWIGSESHQCEQAVAAIKAVDLAHLIRAGSNFFRSHFREVEGEESDAFLEHFEKTSYTIVDDGYPTALRTPEYMFETRLLQIKGIKDNMAIHQIALDWRLINSGDVFILDKIDQVIVWTGKDANVWERLKGLELAQEIKGSSLIAHEKGVEIKFIYEGAEYPIDDEVDFWYFLGADSPSPESQEEGGDDEEVRNDMKLYEWSHEDQQDVLLQRIRLDDGLVRSKLKSNCCYVLDCSSEMFVWHGSKTGHRRGLSELQDLASERAGDLLNELPRDDFVSGSVMIQGSETPLFKSKFLDWGEVMLPSDYLASKVEKVGLYDFFLEEHLIFDVDFDKIHESNAEERLQMIDEIPKSGSHDVGIERTTPGAEAREKPAVPLDLLEDAGYTFNVMGENEEQVWVYMDDGASLIQIDPDGVFDSNKLYIIIHFYKLPQYKEIKQEEPLYTTDASSSIFYECINKKTPNISVESIIQSQMMRAVVYFWKGEDVSNTNFLIRRFEHMEFVQKEIQEMSKHLASEMVLVQQNREPSRFLSLFEAGIIITRDEGAALHLNSMLYGVENGCKNHAIGDTDDSKHQHDPNASVDNSDPLKSISVSQSSHSTFSPNNSLNGLWRNDWKLRTNPFKNHNCQLFHIKGTSVGNVRAVQVECESRSLNSGDAFVLCSPDKVYAWYGRYCLDVERIICEGIYDNLMGYRECIDVNEGNETEDFWDLFIGRNRNYCRVRSHQSSIFTQTPRMLKCSLTSRKLSVKELLVWGQEDLTEYASLMLDVSSQIFLWFGLFVILDERELVQEFAYEYLARCPHKRTIKSCPISIIKQGHEPPIFKSCFHGWDYMFKHEFDDPYVRITQMYERTSIFGKVLSRRTKASKSVRKNKGDKLDWVDALQLS